MECIIHEIVELLLMNNEIIAEAASGMQQSTVVMYKAKILHAGMILL